MNELFGQGAVRYVDVRDEFGPDEYLAWLAFMERWDATRDEREKDRQHDDVMSKAFKALTN